MSRVLASLGQLLGEGFRFAMVGVLATSIYLAGSLVGSEFGLTPYWANLVGYLSSVSFSYFGHSTFTFKSSQPFRKIGAKFFLVSALTYALTNLLVFLVVDMAGRSFFTATIVIACSIPVLTWFLARVWVFRAV